MDVDSELGRAPGSQAELDHAQLSSKSASQPAKTPEQGKTETLADTGQRVDQLSGRRSYEPSGLPQLPPSNWQTPLAAMSPSGRGTPFRQGMREKMSPSSAESSQYAVRPMQLPMLDSRQEEDFLMSFATPSPASQQPQRYHPVSMSEHEGLGMNMPRPLYPEDEGGLSVFRDMSGQRFMRNPMQPPIPAEHRGSMHRAASPARAMSGGQLAMMDGPSRGLPPTHSQEDARGEMSRVPASPMTPSNALHRSASEGFMRGSPRHGGHHRSGSASGLQEERMTTRTGTEQPSTLLAPRTGDSPDFAMIYAFLGSMFDPVCCMINHHDVLSQMCDIDRETSILLLTNISANLDSHGQEIFGRYLNTALQNPVRRGREDDT